MNTQDRVEMEPIGRDERIETRREWVDPEVTAIELSTAALGGTL